VGSFLIEADYLKQANSSSTHKLRAEDELADFLAASPRFFHLQRAGGLGLSMCFIPPGQPLWLYSSVNAATPIF
jgi:hypothetical protein